MNEVTIVYIKAQGNNAESIAMFHRIRAKQNGVYLTLSKESNLVDHNMNVRTNGLDEIFTGASSIGAPYYEGTTKGYYIFKFEFEGNFTLEFSDWINTSYGKAYSVYMSYDNINYELIANNNTNLGTGKIFSTSAFAAYNRLFVKDSIGYKTYLNGWVDSGTSLPSENVFKSHGIQKEKIPEIPESAWSQLAGEIEFCYYTDDQTKTEASFNIETDPFILEEEWEGKEIEVLYYTDDPTVTESMVTIETDPFTLAEEWEDKEIKIIEYTDDPSITESTITIETEPFTLYDELGDNVDVLYYTDDPSKTSAELNIAANYSPLDELEGDFDVVTWSDSNTSKNVQLSSIPSPQLIKQTDDYYMYGDLLAIVDKLNSSNGTLRYAISFNEGSTWEVCKFGKWRTIDISSLDAFKKSGMSHYDISLINSVALKNKGSKIRFAYYIEDNIHNSDPGIEIDNVQLKIDAATDTVKFENLAFYVLNTNATIQLSIAGNKLLGVLDDSDRGKVQYRIFLNNKPYYPTDGNFTLLAPSPQDININISERDLLFNQENTLKVEFQDYWGETDYWQTTFVGSYSGLMFMDETGEYLSDTFGGILRYLQFGEIYAGQTTIDQKVVIKNQLGYPVDEMLLTVNKDVLPSGVGIELSRQQAPFLATDYITYGLTKENETQEFYVRITSDIDAEPVSNGIFELRINAKKT
ncbi:hypothetical protein [Paenibacillus taichungensis]